MSVDPNEPNEPNNNAFENVDANDSMDDINMRDKIQSKFEKSIGQDGSLWKALDKFVPGFGSILSAVVDPTSQAQNVIRNSTEIGNSNNLAGDSQNLNTNISENHESDEKSHSHANVGTLNRNGFDENGNFYTLNMMNFGSRHRSEENEALTQRLEAKAAKRAAKRAEREMRRENQSLSNNSSGVSYTHRYRYVNRERGINTDWDPYASRMQPTQPDIDENNSPSAPRQPVVIPSSTIADQSQVTSDTSNVERESASPDQAKL